MNRMAEPLRTREVLALMYFNPKPCTTIDAMLQVAGTSRRPESAQVMLCASGESCICMRRSVKSNAVTATHYCGHEGGKHADPPDPPAPGGVSEEVEHIVSETAQQDHKLESLQLHLSKSCRSSCSSY